ncbi:hypothetical protein PHYPSEUDO_001107 [Phytophthora pseudosyringae]|uniref:Uncharacterized protein n=1 Tax=Phytophthora pseudosyringae TaxID=221518 RepID=A0A8T1W1A6_9STRA|nr:hypothetical protein PHYPSEUDO_001107 [Phytophthora pseudosyringae]
MKLNGREKRSTTASSIKSVQEAEFAVRSSIAVREEYKAKLRALLSIIAPHSWRGSSPEQPNCERSKIFPKPKQKKKAKRVGLDALEIPEGKEIYVLGDLLLLARAASVDVVENIQAWREVVHGGMPRPYVYDNSNYLLGMCEDLDFLDQGGDLVEWLGFRLVRNPFIVDRAIDDVVSSRLAMSVHEDRSLKYWSSASWRRNTKLTSTQGILPNPSKPPAFEPDPVSKTRWKEHPPPQPLVKPLASISPEDDVVDGSRIAAAQEVLMDEESFHGRLLALKAAQEYLNRGPSTFERGTINNATEPPAVYDAIAMLNSKLKTVEYRSALLRRECAQVERTVRDLRNQTNWTALRRDCDRTKHHRVWHCRDMYRQEALKFYAKLVDKLEHCLEVLNGEENRFSGESDTCKARMSELRVEKDKQRVARHKKKKEEEEAARRGGIHIKTEERSSKLRPKKMIPHKCPQTDPEPVAVGPEEINTTTYENFAANIENDIRVIVKRKSSIRETNRANPGTTDRQLEEKRQTSLYLKRARLDHQSRAAKEHARVLDSRRAENVAMKWEDALSRATEREAKRRARLKAQKEMMDRVASCAMFKCIHYMNGKQFLVSVYTSNARGYDLEGLRVVAYDPSSSAAFTMVMTLREFNSLGYGRTSEGLGAFCRWLCLLYEKRRRQFRLVWSGAPCPAPLRVREHDRSLVCVHKEGVRMRRARADSYSLVAVYLRTDNQSIVRFVVGSWHDEDFLLTEHAVAAHRLVIGSDLDVQWGSAGQATIVWKHHADNFKSEEQRQDNAAATSSGVLRQRIYSSEVVVNRVKYAVHMYDTSETEYTVELIPKPSKGEPVHDAIHPSASKLALYKRQVNPYNVHLSSSNFADLMSLIRFEQTPVRDNSEEPHSKWKATISPKWAGKLANYVRVLRLAKYASKIGGVFCFIAVSIVQQKSEFRAHLLLEVTWLGPTLSSSFSLGGVPTRQSLRIALLEYLRCVNASRRFAVGLTYGRNESEGDEECPSCLAYTEARTKLYEPDLALVPEVASDTSSRCSTCAMIQTRRLHAIQELIEHAGAIAPESLELIYHGYCGVCAALAPPIVLVLGSVSSSMWLLPLLEHYFASFDCSKNSFLCFVDGGEGHSIADELGFHVRDTFLQTLARDQVVVLFAADCGATVASANVFVHELHWWLYPEHHELPCHVAYIVGDNNAELDPVQLDDGGEEESDHASDFDAYLVSEAVLVEATRVLLHPDYAWQKPRQIVGASSWSSACSFLLDPAQLSAHLQQLNPLQLNAATTEVVDAYFAHAKWPRDYPDVRSSFYGLLSFMMHVQHVRHILALRSGYLQSSRIRHHTDEGETAAEQEQLAKNTSVIDCSQLKHVTETTSY